MTITELSPGEQKTIEFYNKNAGSRFGGIFDPDYWRPEFEKFQKFLPAGRIIDIGCGTGRDARLFINGGYEYAGIDLSNGMLVEARKFFPGAVFLKMNMYNLNFRAGAFDGFWAAASLLHIPKKNMAIVLREIKRVVKSGGIGLIVMKEGESEEIIRGPLENDESLVVFYGIEEFAQILQNNGFEILESFRDVRHYEPMKKNYLLYYVRAR